MTTNEQFIALMQLDPSIAIKMRASHAYSYKAQQNLRNTWYISTNISLKSREGFDHKPQVAAATPEAAITAFWCQLVTDAPTDSFVTAGLNGRQVRWRANVGWTEAVNV